MKKTDKLDTIQCRKETDGYEKKRVRFRERIRDAYFAFGWSRKRIQREFGISIHTVRKWTQAADQDCSVDHRGWRQGMRRTHTLETLDRIKVIHQELRTNREEFFTGASAIEREWTLRFPEPAPPLRTIGALLKELQLSGRRTKGRGKGAAAYLHYPEHTLYHGLGGRLIEADFIGRKFLTGRSAPVCFMSYSAKMSPKIRAFQRVEAETTQAFEASSSWFFLTYEEPDFLKLDNATPLLGSTSAKRTISHVARTLLQRRIIPIYSVPRKPFTQASVEGSNSMFARKFWNVRHFTSLEDVDTQLGWFNAAIARYHGYTPRSRRRPTTFSPRIYFLRQVHEVHEAKGYGVIDIQHETIRLPVDYVKYFVLAEWDLEAQRLTVHFENEKTLIPIHEESFPINGKKLEL